MDELIVCPICGNPSINVYTETVKSLTTRDDIQNASWFLCTNPNCDVAYFSKEDIIYKDQVKVPLWYKVKEENKIICYCAGITSNEIKEAIQKGYTNIKEIRLYLNKTTSGMCKYKNPTGRCCHNLFSYYLQKYRSNLE